MSALFVLIGISIIVAGSFLAAFLWSVSQGQYDDDYTPSVRMLFDDDAAPTEKAVTTEENNGNIKQGNVRNAINKKPSTKNHKPPSCR